MQEPPGILHSLRRLVAPLAAILAGLHVLSLGGVVPVDDDYIVYRYAMNWVEHGVHTFNLAEGATDGVTTPLWFWIVSLGVAAGAAPEIWSLAWGAGAMALTALLLAHTGRRLLPVGWAWFPALLFAISPAAAWHARAGLGTLPMAFAMALAVDRLVAFQKGQGRAWHVGAALAAAVLFRLEGALLVVAAAWAMRRSLRTFWPAVAIPVLAAAVVCSGRWIMFGHWLPASGALKALPLAEELEYGARYLLRSFSEGGLALWLAAGACAWAGGTRAEPGKDEGARRLRDAFGATCTLALLFVMLVGGDWMVYGRLMVPFLPVAILGASSWIANWSVGPKLQSLGAVALLAASVVGFAARPQAAFENRFFERWWLDVGQALKEKVEPGRKVALSPIGAIGWSSELPIVDILGLTHDAFHDLPPDLKGVGVKGHHRHSADWVFLQRPDYLILGNGIVQPGTGQVSVNPWEADIVRDSRFQAAYVQDRCDIDRGGGDRGVLPYLRLRSAPRIL